MRALLYVTWDLRQEQPLVRLYMTLFRGVHGGAHCSLPKYPYLGCGKIAPSGSYKRRDGPIPINTPPPQFHIFFLKSTPGV